ncbi:MAG: sialate O-acetylesterase [Verrucomicrobiota bacterium]
MKNKTFIAGLATLVMAVATNTWAELSLPAVIGENAVLQRDCPLPIWGKADAGQTVSVEFAGQKKAAQADAAGKWRVTLDPLPASAQGRELLVQAGDQTLRIGNLLVGDVWLGSGQSNMRLSFEYLQKAAGWPSTPPAQRERIKTDIAAATNPSVRLFVCKTSNRLQGEVDTDGWKVSSPSNLLDSSALAYYFAQEVLRDQRVPVGVITAAWGGTRIELWTPPEAYKKSDIFGGEAKSAGSLVQIDGVPAGLNYDHLIRPLVPFALRGLLWYQGESNILEGDKPARYSAKMELLIASWRNAWGREDMPFYYVQLAPNFYSRSQKVQIPPEQLPAFQDVQRRLLAVPHTGMAVTTDLANNPADIHPLDKWDVGKRLWLWAAADCYGKKGIVPSGPLFKQMEVRNGKAVISFNFTGGGLVAHPSEPLRYFEVCGEDGVYQAGRAVIDGDRVIVSHEAVTHPVAVRYAWNEGIVTPSLYNKEGLPAAPFCSTSAIAEPPAPAQPGNPPHEMMGSRNAFHGK